MKKFLDYQYNPVLFVSVFYYKQVKKTLRCAFDKDYQPKYRTW